MHAPPRQGDGGREPVGGRSTSGSGLVYLTRSEVLLTADRFPAEETAPAHHPTGFKRNERQHMSNRPETDVLVTAADLDDVGVSEMAALRAEINSEAADYQATHTAKQARLDQLTARFAEEEQRRAHISAMTAARQAHNTARTEYDAAAEQADRRVLEFHEAAGTAIAAYAAAVAAERERQNRAAALTSAAWGLEQLGNAPGPVAVAETRLHRFDHQDPMRHIAAAALDGNDALTREVNTLSGTNRRAEIVINTSRPRFA